MKRQLEKTWLTIINDQVQVLNNSKIFAGIMIIILNIASRFVNIKLSKSMESYLKHTFSIYKTELKFHIKDSLPFPVLL